MDTRDVEVAEVTRVQVLAERRAIKFDCRAFDDVPWTITIKMGAATQFLSGLAASPLEHSLKPGTEFFRPLHPKGSRPFRLGTGELGLAFLVADNVEVAYVFHRESIPGIRKQLEELEKL